MEIALPKITSKILESLLLKKELLQAQIKLIDGEIQNVLLQIRIDNNLSLLDDLRIDSSLTKAIVAEKDEEKND